MFIIHCVLDKIHVIFQLWTVYCNEMCPFFYGSNMMTHSRKWVANFQHKQLQTKIIYDGSMSADFIYEIVRCSELFPFSESFFIILIKISWKSVFKAHVLLRNTHDSIYCHIHTRDGENKFLFIRILFLLRFVLIFQKFKRIIAHLYRYMDNTVQSTCNKMVTNE